MTRASLAIAGLIAIGSGIEVAAQRGTADGLVALAHADYEGAAAILKPIAESDSASDTAAQFLMATMYEVGRGAPMDPLRACALYHRAAMNSEAPFGAQADRLMRAMFRARGVEWFADCQALANLGFDHRFEPVTFELAPGHAITWELRGATINYRGQTKPFPMRLAGRGAAFLPLVHTALRSNGASPFPRHFVHVFVWQPAAEGQWGLHWQLFEVVREELVMVTVEDSLLRRRARPAATDAPDPDSLVRLRTTPSGEAEWQILVPGRERTGPIARR